MSSASASSDFLSQAKSLSLDNTLVTWLWSLVTYVVRAFAPKSAEELRQRINQAAEWAKVFAPDSIDQIIDKVVALVENPQVLAILWSVVAPLVADPAKVSSTTPNEFGAMLASAANAPTCNMA